MPDSTPTPPPEASTEAALAARPGSGAFFDAVARRYDLLNRVLSLGLDQRWRRRTVRALELAPDAVCLDLAAGTGDLSLLLAAEGPGVRVAACDPSEGMLGVARGKLGARADRVWPVLGDGQALPFEDASFDAITIAFGIRNVPDRPRALAEMARVCRTGGRVAVLELVEPEGRVLGPLTRTWVHRAVPVLGALLSGAPAYRYLERSIARFPPPDAFRKEMEAAGLEVLEVTRLGFGACALFVATPQVPAPGGR